MYRLEVKNLSVSFAPNHDIEVVKQVSFEISPGEILALVGESGCGKSASCLAIGRLLGPGAVIKADRITFTSSGNTTVDLAKLPEKKLRKLRGCGIAYIFQEPAASLNPVFRIGDQIAEVLSLHRPDITDYKAECIKLLKEVGIAEPQNRLRAFPHELSGGMQQRVMIAMALAGNPQLLIADEPTTALDVTIQAQILELLDRLRKERNMAVILVTHNLGIVAEYADRVCVMYAGTIVESATVAGILEHPQHPYTRALLRAVPKLGEKNQYLETIPGSVGNPADFPEGCRFARRCQLAASLGKDAQKICNSKVPDGKFSSPDHSFCCHFSGSNE